jgi:predicted metalloprotease with PDZ domain
MSLTRAVLAAVLATAFNAQAAADSPYPGTIVLKVDATDTAQNIFRVRETIPAKAGKLTLLYPQWIPGNHGPSGALSQFAGFKASANGQPLDWVRDPVNVFAFHLNVPKGASAVEVEFEYLSPVEASQGRTTMTNDILGVQWQSVTLYPAGYSSRAISVQPNLTLPAGWQYGSALEQQERRGDNIAFKPLDLETLVDSPLFAGRYLRRIDLDPGAKIPVHLNVVADSADQLEATPEQIAPHREMVQQAYKLFNSQHYKHYDFLFAISDEFGGIGREHHQSSENGVKLGYFAEWNKYEARRELLSHEFTHSWNGKFRRPAGQSVADFNTPLQNELLWVYEGQTQYWGAVLAARAGLIKPEHTRDLLAATAARYDNVRGREWRAVQDTVNDPIVNARRPQGWNNWQRAEDYYSEGQLIWLDADTKIRELSGDKRSLNDFARSFFGVDDGVNVAKPYTFEDVVKALNAVQAYDWAPFLRSRLDGHGPGAPLDGLARAGWKLVYSDQPTDFLKAQEDLSKSANFQYSLGLSLRQLDPAERRDSGLTSGLLIQDAGGAAADAGVLPGDVLLSVNGRPVKNIDEVRDVVGKAGKSVALLIQRGDEKIFIPVRLG